jgi:hypothetical protein
LAAEESVTRRPLEQDAMDARTADQIARALATMIGELMEDSVGIALTPPPGDLWPELLVEAAHDIAALAATISIVQRRAENAAAPRVD